jgi:lipopolysaccharide/colanic/teichoic acid biosynthesis glycosyltransferase
MSQLELMSPKARTREPAAREGERKTARSDRDEPRDGPRDGPRGELSLVGSTAGREAADAGEERWTLDLEAAVLRALDVVVAVVALIVLLPVLAVIAVLIRLTGSGPVFYRQLRVGVDTRRSKEDRRNGGETVSHDERRRGPDRRVTDDLGGRPFWIYKFRTMRVDAESETGPVWSPNGDGRTTPIGQFLRRHRLDEIPQFWNVLKGEMSVVGPRPERPPFFERLREEIDHYPLRQTVLPGITGWAQVNRGYDESFDDVREKLRYDLEYVERRSLLFQIRIMFETIFVMVGRRAPFTDLSGVEDARNSGLGEASG